MTLVVFSAAMTLFFVLQAIYWAVASRQRGRRSALAERLGTAESTSEADALLKDTEEGGGLSQSLVAMMERAGEDPNLGALYAQMAMFSLGGAMAALIVLQEPFVALLAALAGLFVPVLILRSKHQKRVARIEEMLPEALEVMIISLRAGQSLEQTIRMTARELEDPIGTEFRRVAEENELGRPLDEALLSMADRLERARTVRTLVVSVLVLRQTGGNLIEVLESIIDTMRQQTQYERKLIAMTAEGRSSARMLKLLPLAFVFLANLVDPDYASKMLGTGLGQFLTFAAGMLYFSGLLWVNRLMKPKS